MKRILALMVVAVMAISCQSKDTTIALDKVGPITNNTSVQELAGLFKNDSIVSRLSEGDLGNMNDYIADNDTYLIYQKGGKLLLSISPINPLDSVSKIKSVTIFSDEYKTKGNVGLGSTFNDLNINHNIEKLEATFKLVTVFVKDINATFTIDKQEVGIKAFTLGDIDKKQIPENSKFTSFTVWLDE
ncbi:hypothetical protein AXE80_04025 [Wenyingzhuangia fucanilytica]|uniref:Lipoprotein n=1 Tax=Wenyingzhuangia fucanilytica TaxID=1790137 RepID=A0A1B1Y406_9FLAO|nr:hypothetical protein [Wenyingzhuangia fucanilytica]ANW95496.1 hypothetical protein AXE80_04025 [Wenyingzhuangia fucanilytica]